MVSLAEGSTSAEARVLMRLSPEQELSLPRKSQVWKLKAIEMPRMRMME
jgi:hypothetical protein